MSIMYLLCVVYSITLYYNLYYTVL